MEAGVFQILQVAPTPILGLVLYILWKIDRRLLKVEHTVGVEDL